jgi:hypothetical protein
MVDSSSEHGKAEPVNDYMARMDMLFEMNDEQELFWSTLPLVEQEQFPNYLVGRKWSILLDDQSARARDDEEEEEPQEDDDDAVLIATWERCMCTRGLPTHTD